MPVRVFGDEELALLKEVLDSGNLSGLGGGKMTPRFEKEFAEALGAKHGVAMNSAMSVLHAAVKAAGAGAGDEVLCDPVCVFGAIAAMYNNAVPVFVDVKRQTWNMDPDRIEEKITGRTKALIVTHVWGLAAEMDRIVDIAHRHGLIVIEDCAHSLFATYKGRNTGTWGDIGSFSFQMSKQIGLGDGGMAVTDSDELAKQLSLNAGAPTFGSVAFDLHYNYRITELVAAVGIGQLHRARGYIQGLIEIAEIYDRVIRECPWIALQRGPAESTHTFHLWGATFRGDEVGIELKDFKAALKETGAGISVGYTNMPAYRHPAIAQRLGYGRGCPLDCPHYQGTGNRYPDGLCPNTEWVMPRILMTWTYGTREHHQASADRLRKAIQMMG
jgi:dTDP-4-amino-4,6-dideoxygalactose transaminase